MFIIESIVICSKMDRTKGHYVKWSKSDTVREVLHALSHIWKLKQVNMKVD
jgi:hypothetical protein